MKIGILTFHNAHNYGAVLQAFALREYLISLGHNVEFINYHISEFDKYALYPFNLNDKGSLIKKIKLLIVFVLSLYRRILRHKKFNQFIKKHLISSRKMSRESFNVKGSYNAIVFGSDQIWNPLITKGFDPVYWGEFNAGDEVLKVAYAASMDQNLDTSEAREIATKFLRNFNSIGVRENSMIPLLKCLTNKKIHHVLDPTFIVDKSCFERIKKTPKINKKYVLTYTVLGHPMVLSLANKIAKELNCSIINLASNISAIRKFNTIETSSPEEFIGYIANAQCIITTSFHATVFSILYKRPFYTINLTNTGRTAALLKDLGLETRLVNLTDDMPCFSNCCYDSLDNKLLPKVEKSKIFIKNAIR